MKPVISALKGAVSQAQASGILGLQCRLNRLLIRAWDQRIKAAAQTMQLSMHQGQQLQAGGSSTGPPTAHPCPIKIQADLHISQGGGQKSGMAPEAEPHHRDPQRPIIGFKLLAHKIDRGLNIRKDRLGARGLLMKPAFAGGLGVMPSSSSGAVRANSGIARALDQCSA